MEAIGVTTGVVFESYAYGDPFGIKIFETHIMIGVNWFFFSTQHIWSSSILYKKSIMAYFNTSNINDFLRLFSRTGCHKIGFFELRERNYSLTKLPDVVYYEHFYSWLNLLFSP